jgi:hypothetical protein
MELLFLIPITISVFIAVLTVATAWLLVALIDTRKKMEWWKSEAIKLSGDKLKEANKPPVKHYQGGMSPWWIRKRK